MLDKEELKAGVARGKYPISTEGLFIIIALIDIGEAVDRYIEQRIKSDKVLEGVLKDIYSAVQESGP